MFLALLFGDVDLTWHYGQEGVDTDDGPRSAAGGASCWNELVLVRDQVAWGPLKTYSGSDLTQ